MLDVLETTNINWAAQMTDIGSFHNVVPIIG